MSDDIKLLLAELQKTYLASLPEKITNLESLWKSGDLDRLETEYHKLKGTGRTYGLPEVSLLGEALENLCESRQPELIDAAVPISLELLIAIKEQRRLSQILDIETQPGFIKVSQLLTQIHQTKS